MRSWLSLLLLTLGISFAHASAFDDPPPPPALSGVASQYYSGTGVFSVPSGAGSTGNVVGSGVTVVGHAVCWNNTSATAAIDCGVAPTGTVTSVSGSGGTSGLTLTGGPITTAGTLTLGGTLNVANGGTGITAFGTGVAGALGNNVNAASGLLTYGIIGTSGATLGMLNANKTDSGNNTLSGTLALTGIPSGTIASGKNLGLDVSGNVVVAAVSGGSGLTINSTAITSSTAGYLLYSDGTKLQQETIASILTAGNGISITGTTNATISATVTDTLHAASATTANIGGQDDYNGSSITATLATLAAGQTLLITDQNASSLTVALGGQTVVGLPLATKVHNGGFYGFTFNSGGTLSGFGYPGNDTITSGALIKYADASGAGTAADLTGDVTTSGAVATTLATVNSNVGSFTSANITVNAKGLITAAANGTASAASVTPGTTTVIGATAPCLLENSASTTLACAPVGSNVLGAAANALSAAGGISTTVASGTSALGTGAISSATCATVVTTTATNTATTDVILWGFNGDPTGVTGYTPVTTGALTIFAYPSANNVNFKTCNLTTGSITPGAITLNWRVVR